MWFSRSYCPGEIIRLLGVRHDPTKHFIFGGRGLPVTRNPEALRPEP